MFNMFLRAAYFLSAITVNILLIRKRVSAPAFLSLKINISPPLSHHHLFFSPPHPFSQSTHCSVSLFFYGWLPIFPWDSGGGEFSRRCCFIIPNKSGNMFRPPYIGFTGETHRQKLFFSCLHVLLMHSALFTM